MDGARRRQRTSGNHAGDERAVSTVVGVALLLLIVLLMAVTAGSMFLDLGQSGLSTVHDQGMFEGDITKEGERAVIESRAVKEYSEEVDFVLEVNGEEVRRWDGQDSVEIECLYPGDHVQLFSKGPEQTFLIDEYYFDRATECPGYRTFPEKFEHVVVDGTAHAVNDRYAFGLTIKPDDDDSIGNVSLSNEWHHVKLYNEEIEGFEPPVFVMMLVDNVHQSGVPPGYADEYGWDDAPPSDLTIGEDAYEVNGGDVAFTPAGAGDATEPTDDLLLVFKPGCDGSDLRLIGVEAGYENKVYLDGEEIIDDTSKYNGLGLPGDDQDPRNFSAPGVECNGPAEW